MKKENIFVKVCLSIITLTCIVLFLMAISLYSEGKQTNEQINSFLVKLNSVDFDKINSVLDVIDEQQIKTIIDDIDAVDTEKANNAITNLYDVSMELKDIDFTKLNLMIDQGSKTMKSLSSLFDFN